ncbi:hypothetical protein, conserved [Eimeria brunetti]|uniref:Kelch motif domain-containing protein n=1 Tax=Eimeria brunetti TaxID=51314 RepID=U6LH81_9EIME|nr:hypothetical protein, conserved [Eimeria brunetti]
MVLGLPRSVAFAAAAASLLAADSCFGSDSLQAPPSEWLNPEDGSSSAAAAEGSLSATAAAAAAGSDGSAAGEDATESMEVRVAEIQAMDESDLKLNLRSLYSVSKDAQEKQIFPVGSLEAMQEILNSLGSVDEEQRDVLHFMNRFAYLLAKTLHNYNLFFSLKVALSDPSLSAEDYAKEVQKMPLLAAKWTDSSDLLLAYLNFAARDLRDKWEAAAAAEARLRGLLQFIEALQQLYAAQQQLFRKGYALARLRYMQHKDRQADISDLIHDPRQKQMLIEFEDALENNKELCHRARKSAKKCTEDGFLPQEYLALLPFPPDKQREEDDLPEYTNDEM